MADGILALEPWLRGAVFICALLIMSLWELLASKRPQRISRRRRWPHIRFQRALVGPPVPDLS